MNESLKQYIDSARKEGHSDAQILKDMVAGGWSETVVKAGLAGKEPLAVPPPPPPPGMSAAAGAGANPIAVVSSLSTRGFEYWIMFISLGVTAVALGIVLHNLVDGAFGGLSGGLYENYISAASSALLVALPVFAFLFLRLKKAELAGPHLVRDASRRRAVQLTLIVTFLIALYRIIRYLNDLLNGDPGVYGSQASPAVNLIHAVITLGIAGGIFVYYWLDQHRSDK